MTTILFLIYEVFLIVMNFISIQCSIVNVFSILWLIYLVFGSTSLKLYNSLYDSYFCYLLCLHKKIRCYNQISKGYFLQISDISIQLLRFFNYHLMLCKKQVTKFRCGAFALGLAMNHCMADDSGIYGTRIMTYKAADRWSVGVLPFQMMFFACYYQSSHYITIPIFSLHYTQ